MGFFKALKNLSLNALIIDLFCSCLKGLNCQILFHTASKILDLAKASSKIKFGQLHSISRVHFILSLPAREEIIFRERHASACLFLKKTPSQEQREIEMHPISSYRISLIGIVLLIALFPNLSRAQINSAKGNSQTLRVAVYHSPPFGFRNQDGSYGGLMVEIWEDIAKELDYQYTYDTMDIKGVLTGLEEKRYDIGLDAISITPEREKQVDFTQPVNPSGTGVAFSKARVESAFELYWKPILVSLSQLIGSLLLVLLISGTIVWLVERNQTDSVFDRKIRGLGMVCGGLLLPCPRWDMEIKYPKPCLARYSLLFGFSPVLF